MLCFDIHISPHSSNSAYDFIWNVLHSYSLEPSTRAFVCQFLERLALKGPLVACVNTKVVHSMLWNYKNARGICSLYMKKNIQYKKPRDLFHGYANVQVTFAWCAMNDAAVFVMCTKTCKWHWLGVETTIREHLPFVRWYSSGHLGCWIYDSVPLALVAVLSKCNKKRVVAFILR